MMIFQVAAIALALVAGQWGFTVAPPFGGASFDVGDWGSLAECRDMKGSFENAHPFACHTRPSNFNCRVTGNGQAYPRDVVYPRPQGYPAVVISDCIQARTPMGGWHFLEYHSLPTPGGSAPRCSEFAKFKALADSDPAHFKVATVSKGCGGPCWPSRRDNACF